ncbi:MAG: hypothetical protein ABSH44_00120 [Bryobacteraceae bacterium]|jgi:hypothetical protein
MRTTIRLDDGLLGQARREAQRRGETLTSLIAEGVRRELARSKPERRRPKVKLPVFDSSGGVMPGVDLNNSAALLGILEEGLPIEKRR